MKIHIALLRGINVGGSGKLPMAELRSLCEGLGFMNVRTYIQSGNVLFESDLGEKALHKKLGPALQNKMKKQVPVIIRTVDEMESVIASNPFPDANPSQVGVMFFADKLQDDLLENVVIPGREKIRISGREIYIHYPDGIGRSRLKLPLEKQGTMRNINTVSKLAGMGRSDP